MLTRAHFRDRRQYAKQDWHTRRAWAVQEVRLCLQQLQRDWVHYYVSADQAFNDAMKNHLHGQKQNGYQVAGDELMGGQASYAYMEPGNLPTPAEEPYGDGNAYQNADASLDPMLGVDQGIDGPLLPEYPVTPLMTGVLGPPFRADMNSPPLTDAPTAVGSPSMAGAWKPELCDGMFVDAHGDHDAASESDEHDEETDEEDDDTAVETAVGNQKTKPDNSPFIDKAKHKFTETQWQFLAEICSQHFLNDLSEVKRKGGNLKQTKEGDTAPSRQHKSQKALMIMTLRDIRVVNHPADFSLT